MILEKGDMWSVFNTTDIFMITTNPIIKKDGSVVMGRGIAAQAKGRFPELPYQFGQELKNLGYDGHPINVGYISHQYETPIWFFMVKDHWMHKASLDIIQQSVKELDDHFRQYPDTRVDLNFPGIGNGGLSREEVLPLLEGLPDNVHIWEYE